MYLNARTITLFSVAISLLAIGCSVQAPPPSKNGPGDDAGFITQDTGDLSDADRADDVGHLTSDDAGGDAGQDAGEALDGGGPLEDGGALEDGGVALDAGELPDTDVAEDGGVHDSCVVDEVLLCMDRCGEMDNGCGGTVDCGGCEGVETCGGRGEPNICGCPPQSDEELCAQEGVSCANISVADHCGDMVVAHCGECEGGTTCVSGSCIDCSLNEHCVRAQGCSLPFLFEASSRMRFSNLETLTGINEEYLGCGFVTANRQWQAICSIPTAGTQNNNRLRPHSFRSDDALQWSYRDSTVKNPTGYWNGSRFIAGSTTFFSHRNSYPIVLSNGHYLMVSENYFSVSGGEWVNFVPFWHSATFDSWEGYNGTSDYGERFVISFGHFSKSGLRLPAVFQKPDRSFVAYAKDAPHSNSSLANPAFHRYTAQPVDVSGGQDRGLIWEKDDGFLLEVPVFEDERDGRIFILADNLYLYSHRQDEMVFIEGETQEEDVFELTCTAHSKWSWAFSTTGEQGTFGGPQERLSWGVDSSCRDYIDPCDIKTPFFVKVGNRVRLFFQSSSTGEWRTALSDFRLY